MERVRPRTCSEDVFLPCADEGAEIAEGIMKAPRFDTGGLDTGAQGMAPRR
jgi:hypothetical protein